MPTKVMPVVDRGEIFYQDNQRIYAKGMESGFTLPGWTTTCRSMAVLSVDGLPWTGLSVDRFSMPASATSFAWFRRASRKPAAALADTELASAENAVPVAEESLV